MGDIIHALPAASALRKRFPDAQITWLVKKAWSEILEGNSGINSIQPVDFSWKTWPRLITRLRKFNYDLVIDLQGLFRSGLIGYLSGAPIRIGFSAAREGAPWFYSHAVDLPGNPSEPWRLIGQHAVERNNQLVKFLGADSLASEFPLPSLSDDCQAVEKYLQAAGVQSDHLLIAIAPWSRSVVKSWPLSRYLELTQKLLLFPQHRVVVLGSQSDLQAGEKFVSLEQEGLINLIGKIPLRALPPLLRRMRLLVGNDSAVLHMAAGVGIPVIGIFGPTLPQATGPYPLEKQTVLRTELPCSPCGKRTCFNSRYLECLETISVKAVTEKIVEVLGLSIRHFDAS